MNIINFNKDDTDKVTKNFTISEFACPCRWCDKSYIDTSLIKVLQDVRDHFNKPIRINSAFRCTIHNNKVGGAKSSQHLFGKAADIVVQGILPQEVQE